MSRRRKMFKTSDLTDEEIDEMMNESVDLSNESDDSSGDSEPEYNYVNDEIKAEVIDFNRPKRRRSQPPIVHSAGPSITASGGALFGTGKLINIFFVFV